MSQRSFPSAEFALKGNLPRCEKFLADMERVVPWARLTAVIEPLYPTSGLVGRRPMSVSKMLRMYFLQQWYGLEDEALGDAIYDSQGLWDFVGIDLSRESMPKATTLLNFRRLLVTNSQTKVLFDEINVHLAQQGLLMSAGTMVDATVIAAPSSTKNACGERAQEMHQAKKGNQWHHGMKAHIGVDAESGVVPSLVSTAANVNDVTQAGELLHDEKANAFGDAAYRGVAKREEAHAPQRQIGMQPSKRQHLSDSPVGQMLENMEKIKASIRAKVERSFHLIKDLFRRRKTRYRGLAKNHAQLLNPSGLANLVLAKNKLLQHPGTGTGTGTP